jgi:hypothetical protein
MERNPYAAPSTVTDINPAKPSHRADGPSGLGGWLIPVGVGLVLGPLRLIALLVQTFVPMFENGTWEALTSPESSSYHPLWAPILIGELTVNIVFALTYFYLLVLFFRKSPLFPKVFIALILGSLVFILVDTLAVSVVLPNEPLFDADTVGELARSLVAATIWIPYMLISKRVKNTFV